MRHLHGCLEATLLHEAEAFKFKTSLLLHFPGLAKAKVSALWFTTNQSFWPAFLSCTTLSTSFYHIFQELDKRIQQITILKREPQKQNDSPSRPVLLQEENSRTAYQPTVKILKRQTQSENDLQKMAKYVCWHCTSLYCLRYKLGIWHVIPSLLIIWNVKCPDFGGTVPILAQMSRCPACRDNVPTEDILSCMLVFVFFKSDHY